MHDTLLETLRSVARRESRCASFQDNRLSFPKDSDLRVFVPDLHLVSAKARKRYSYGTNLTDLLTSIARALRALRAQKSDAEDLAIYQIGRILLRSLARKLAPTRIPMTPLTSKMATPAWSRLYCIRISRPASSWATTTSAFRSGPPTAPGIADLYLPFDGTPTVILLHGDAFDWVETFPDEVNSFFVSSFGPLASANDYGLDEMRKLANKSHRNRKYKNSIQQPNAAPLLNAMANTAGALPASPFNVHEGGHEFLNAAADTCAKASREYSLDLRLAVIGHTHHARLATRTGPNGELFTLMDCGAWIENCAFPDGTTMPDAQDRDCERE